MSRWLLFVALVLFGSVAHASDRPRDPDRAFHDATWLALSGGIVGGAGLVTFGLGLPLVVEGPEHTKPGAYGFGMALYGGGYVALAVCGGMVAGGSLAARQVLVNRHGLRVPAWPALLATTAWGGTLALAVVVPALTGARPNGWLTASSFVATHALGVAQLLINRRAWRSLPDDAPVKQVRWTMAPQAGRRQVGMAVVGTF